MSDRIQIIQPAQGMTEYWRRVDEDPLMVVIAERVEGQGDDVTPFVFSTCKRALDHATANTLSRFVIYTRRIDDPEWGERVCDG
jgi:hypothetical protein